MPVHRSLAPVLIWEWSIWFIVLTGVATALLFVFNWTNWIGISLLSIGFLLLYGLVVWLIRKSVAVSAYAFREHDLLSRKGWLFQQTNVVPLNKIQHIVIKTGPIEKRYGLASLKVLTAAGSLAEITIAGLTSEEAARLKDWITNQNQVHGS